MIRDIDHIAIAVEDLNKAIELYESLFELKIDKKEHIPSQGVDTATFKIGGTEIELIEGKSDSSPIKKYIEKRGPGIHHIAFSVENIEDAIAKLGASSVKFINDEPSTGKGNSRIVFIHPSSTQGILYELVEPGEIKKD